VGGVGRVDEPMGNAFVHWGGLVLGSCAYSSCWG
jgi:hypothetical protein